MFKLLRFLRPYWWQVALLLISVAAQVWCSLQLPALMANIVNDGIMASNMDFILQTGFTMLGFTLLAIVFAVMTHFFSARVGAAFSRDLREAFYKKVISFSITEIDKFSTASLLTRTTNDIGQVQQAIMLMLTMMLRAPLMGIVSIIQAFRTAPDMTWILALGVGLIFFFSVIILSLAIPKFKLFQSLIDKITLLARENLTGLRVIRAFNKESHEKAKFARANDDLTKNTLFLNKVMSFQDPLISLIFNMVTILIIWVGLSHLETDVTYLGNMLAFVQYSTHVLLSFLLLTMLFVILPRASVSAGRLNEVFTTKNKIVWKAKTAGRPDVAPSVEFRHVSFAYAGADKNVLSNISFTAKSGTTTAFVGSTGSGKSTLVSLVPRFYEATSGEVLVDGLDVKNFSAADLMQRIGYVPQKGLLFAGDVSSNISFGNEFATATDVVQAATTAQAKSFIEKLPKTYLAHIAQGGSNVSGGQKQRLSIARAIAKKPEIYIFDDSFSALDMKTDRALREALKPITKDSVVLIVAQRVSTIKSADQIIVLDSGRIVGQGTHKKLLKTCKVYREIVKSQLSETEYKKEVKNA
ncbi:ABC transporter ATP-binding protein [Candidatus Saccharibacteria bacterium]|nr:ABC transporter ATP-binding protein [Candidatus Saccharibacteria bacterium]